MSEKNTRGFKRQSAGLLMCRRRTGEWEFLLAHPGGPFFARKDEGSWSLPKGCPEPGEEPLEAAKREFREETGFSVDAERLYPLGRVVQKGGKVVDAWAFVGDCDPATIQSNTFEIEWPPRSGRFATFPEIDRVAFFDVNMAKKKLLPAQAPFVDRALEALGTHARDDAPPMRHASPKPMPKTKAVLYHNPRCTKSREALALLQERGVDLEVVEYLKNPLTADEVKAILKKLGGKPSALLRSKEEPYAKLRLSSESTSDEVATAIAKHPILLERPLLVVGAKAVIGRPPENVLAIL